MNLLPREAVFVIFTNGGTTLGCASNNYLEWYYQWSVQDSRRLSAIINKLCLFYTNQFKATTLSTILKLVTLAGARWNWSSIMFGYHHLPQLLKIVDEIGGWDPSADGQFAMRAVMTNGIMFADDRPFSALIYRTDID
jgi:hypothetical protein